MVKGEERQLEAARHAHFAEDVGQVPLHGIFAERELLRDLFVRVAGDDRRDDLLLARRDLQLSRASTLTAVRSRGRCACTAPGTVHR